MEASVRLLHSSHPLLRRTLKPPSTSSFPPRHHHHHHNHLFLNLHHPKSTPQFKPKTPFQTLNHSTTSRISNNPFAHIFSSSQNDPPLSFSYSLKPHQENRGVVGDGGPVVTAVLLGWLGSKEKHLRRYVELYKARGINCVTFVAGVGDVLSFDLGRRLEERIKGLANELASWVKEKEVGGKERVLMFHTFSNTGWLAYGAILESFRGRDDLLEKIKGCVVDSGGDPNIDPKVWAAGFTAALLKKRNTPASASNEERGENLESAPELTVKQKEPQLLETILLYAFEKLFSYLLNLPDINRRLVNIIRALNDQPPCPQLYLYSTEDKVIPCNSVESFIDYQRRGGQEVWSHNFVSSPHVDHYRTFPDVYASELETFLEKCVRGRSREM